MKYLTIVFSIVVFSSCLTIDMVSKGYTESQARLLVEQLLLLLRLRRCY